VTNFVSPVADAEARADRGHPVRLALLTLLLLTLLVGGGSLLRRARSAEAMRGPALTPLPTQHAPRAPRVAVATIAATQAAPETAPTPAAAPARATQPAHADLVRALEAARLLAARCGAGLQAAQVVVTFAPNGSVQSARFGNPAPDPKLGACVLNAVSAARVAPFSGQPMVVSKMLRW